MDGGAATLRPFEYTKRLDEPGHHYAFGQTAPLPIVYQVASDLNRADAQAYAHCPVFTQEATWIADINQILDEGEGWIAKLYTYRSCAKGIPSTTATDQAGKTDMNQVMYEVLTPQIEKVKAILAYAASAVQSTADLCRVLTARTAATQQGAAINIYFVTPTMHQHLARLLNLLLTIDELKDMKACIINDVSIQKRAAAHLRSAMPELNIADPQQANQALYNALQQHGWCLQDLQQQITSIPGIADLLFECATTCATAIEEKWSLRPRHRLMLLKASAVALMLISKLEGKSKKWKTDRFVKLFKQTPVAPLCGDMNLTFADFFKRSKQHADFLPSNDFAPSSTIPFDLAAVASTYQESYTSLLRDLSAQLNMMSTDETVALNTQHAETMYRLTCQCLRLMADTSTKVLELNAWKFLHPASTTSTKPAPPADASSYELAVRYNYTQEEMMLIANMVIMLKTLASKMRHHLPLLKKGIKENTVEVAQAFAHGPLHDTYLHAIKKKRASADAIQELSFVLAQSKLTAKQVGPPNALMSVTQLEFVNAMALSIFGDREKRPKQGLMKERDYKDTHYDEVDAFLDKVHVWPELWQLDETIRACQDLSDLWFKEFYLEITKEIQFPIDTSLPWLITSRLLTAEQGESIEDIFFPLDIYNDAARASLFDLKCQYLFDEVEAETNLCFVQLVFELGQRIYTHYKQAASLTLVERRFKTNLESFQGFDYGHYDCPKRTYETILRQKSIQLLGRSIDLNVLLTQSCNQSLRKSVDVAISRFEASDLNYIKELESLLDVTRMTHTLLSPFLALDAWEDILVEVDERTGWQQYGGRIYSHLINELTLDLCPNQAYNATVARFVRAPINMVSPPARQPFAREKVMHHYGSKHLFTLYAAEHQLYKGFIGQEHTDAILRLIGIEMAPRLVDDLSQHIGSLIRTELTAYVDAVNKGMPYTAKLPPNEFGLKGAFDYFMVVLKPLLTYRDMKTGVFQTLREVGNAIAFAQMLQQSYVTYQRHRDYLLDSHMTHVQDLGGITASMQMYLPQAEAYQQLKVTTAYMTAGIERQNLEHAFLDQLKQNLYQIRERWEGNENVTQYLTEEHVREFHRVWSVAFFVYNLPPQSSNEFTNRQLFGDAFLIGGSTIVCILDEAARFQTFDFTHYLRYTFRKDILAMQPTSHHLSSANASSASSASATAAAASASSHAVSLNNLTQHHHLTPAATGTATAPSGASNAGGASGLGGASGGGGGGSLAFANGAGGAGGAGGASSADKSGHGKDKDMHQLQRFLESAKLSIDVSIKTFDRLSRLRDEIGLDVATT